MNAGPPAASGGPMLPPDLSPSYLAETRVPEIYASVITVTVAATIAVALRFLCRSMVKAKLWYDDWIIVLALILEWALSAILLYATLNLGFGRHVELMEPWQMEPMGKILVATQLLYYAAQAAIKFSLLLLYHRIFGVGTSRFRYAIYIVGCLVIMWFLASFIDSILECIPVQAEWNTTIQHPKCQDIREAALATGISNLIFDIIILALPVPMIWRLKVDTRVKASLTFIFLLGIFVCAISILRIESIFSTNWKLTDPTWDGFGLNVWSTVESCCAVIGACLPTMRPLITGAKKLATLSKSIGSNSRTTEISLDPQSPRPALLRPAKPSQNAPYQNLDEVARDLVAGQQPYEVKHAPGFIMQEPRSQVIRNCGRTQGPHPVIQSQRLAQERMNAPLPTAPRFTGPEAF